MITFHAIRFKNFLSVGAGFQTLRLSAVPLTLIVGKNGKGKSVILDAITYALYGRPFRKVKNADLINNINKKDCLVEISFAIGTTRYMIRRGLKPNIFEVWIDGKIRDNDGVDAQQAFVENEILKMGIKAFKQITVVGKASYVPFLELSPADRRSIVEDLLDIGVFASMLSLAKQENADCDRLKQDLQSKMSTVSALISLNEQHKKETATQYDDMITFHEEEKSRRQEALDRSTQDVKMAELNIEATEKDIAERFPKSLQDAQTLREKFAAAMTESQFRLRQIEQQLDFLRNNSSCPKCLQTIDADHITHLETSEEVEKVECERKATEQKEKIQKLDDYISTLRLVTADLNEKVMLLRRNRQTVESLTQEIEGLNRLIQQTIEKKNAAPAAAVDDDLYGQQSQLASQMVEVNDQKELLIKTIGLLGDGGLKAKFIEQFVPTINTFVNTFIEKMGLFLSVELDSEFNEKIFLNNVKQVEYYALSEGQKLRINLAILFVWREIARVRNAINTNILVLDEVLDGSLDDEGAEDFMRIVNEGGDNRNTLIISHKGSMVDSFDNIVRVDTVGMFTEYTT